MSAKWNRENLWQVLEVNNDQLGKALLALYQRQTDAEKETHNTNEANGIGFNGVDAPFLSSCAEGVKKYGRLTDKQATSVRKALKKYIGQLVDIANEREAYKEVAQV